MTAGALTRDVVRRCHELGFALAGVCAARPSDHAAALRDWLDAGRHGEMTYLERFETLCDPDRLLPGARSIVCVADRYAGPRAAPAPGSTGRGRIARYARGGDYHKVMKRRLHELADGLRADHPDHAFRACVDTAPLLEREHAQRAGLGAVGKHTLLIEPGIGSWILLGELVTTLDLAPAESRTGVDPCASCTRCIDACPTDAITPWSVDATRCISYLTIEHRGRIDGALHAGMGDWIFGCDVCQDVCPHNQPTERSRAIPVHEAYAARHDGFDLLEVLAWSEDDRRAAFTGSALKRARLTMMKRNALIAAGNRLAGAADPGLRAAVERIAADPDEDAMVRATAAEVLDRSNAP